MMITINPGEGREGIGRRGEMANESVEGVGIIVAANIVIQEKEEFMPLCQSFGPSGSSVDH